MKFFLISFIYLFLYNSLVCLANKQKDIPKGAFFYDQQWKGIKNANQASYYRIVGVDSKNRKVFYDYYITGQLKAEKHYISINKEDDRKTILDGIARTFYKNGRVETIMQYKNGKAHGRAVSFYASGSVGMKLNYTNGLLDGASYTYSEDGRIEHTTIWKNGNKINEFKGGNDKYIDAATKQDLFTEQYRKDEADVMAQARKIYNSDNNSKRNNQENTYTPKQTQQQVNSYTTQTQNIEQTNTNSINNPSEYYAEDLASKVKYPNEANTNYQENSLDKKTPQNTIINNSNHQTTEGKVLNNPSKLPEHLVAKIEGAKAEGRLSNAFSFRQIYNILTDISIKTNNTSFFDQIGADLGLPLAQTIQGLGAQKEYAYSYNMYFDEDKNKDVINGPNPRQIGFYGASLDHRVTVQRINLYTSSEIEMLNFAHEALNMGYKVLGTQPRVLETGNFVLENPEHNKAGDPLAIIIAFTYNPNLYSGLYHIRIEIK